MRETKYYWVVEKMEEDEGYAEYHWKRTVRLDGTEPIYAGPFTEEESVSPLAKHARDFALQIHREAHCL